MVISESYTCYEENETVMGNGMRCGGVWPWDREATLDKKIREGFSEEVTFEPRHIQ